VSGAYFWGWFAQLQHSLFISGLRFPRFFYDMRLAIAARSTHLVFNDFWGETGRTQRDCAAGHHDRGGSAADGAWWAVAAVHS